MFLRKILDLLKIFRFVPIIAYFTVAKNTPSARFFGGAKKEQPPSDCSAAVRQFILPLWVAPKRSRYHFEDRQEHG